MLAKQWFKGNIHTHTTESDGDASPQQVVEWYRSHGYDFLVLSDHNHLTILEHGRKDGRASGLLMVPGEEVSVNLNGGAAAVHINGIGISRLVEPIDATDVVATLQANIDAIRQAGGIASINHPNYKWSFDDRAIVQVSGASLLEVFNAHHAVNTYGGSGRPGSEEIWDRVLSAGKVIFGAATDDSHNYHDFAYNRSNPGRGWVVVRAQALESEAVLEALATGEFYSSTGVALRDLTASPESVSLSIVPERDFMYTTAFIGRDGKVFAQVEGLEPCYEPHGDEGYVRAVVKSSSGPKAWTQPVFLK